jgi:hypothetical protein
MPGRVVRAKSDHLTVLEVGGDQLVIVKRSIKKQMSNQ